MNYVMKYKAKNWLSDFYATHPEILKPRKVKYFFGLIQTTRMPTFCELINEGKITPEQADEILTNQVLVDVL